MQWFFSSYRLFYYHKKEKKLKKQGPHLLGTIQEWKGLIFI